jgi:hypothetical protein
MYSELESEREGGQALSSAAFKKQDRQSPDSKYPTISGAYGANALAETVT